MSDDPLEPDPVLEKLNAALPLQQRSALQYTLLAGSVYGVANQGLSDRLWSSATAELEDARRLVEKIGALGGEPVTEVAPLFWDGSPDSWVATLIEAETEAVTALQGVIPATGNDAASEALEHLIEHLLLRKQEQIDWLERVRRAP
jgi:bacterioferritin (cytochrome b1)